MKQRISASIVVPAVAIGVFVAAGAAQTPQAPPQQPNEVRTDIIGDSGAPPRLALPAFIPLSNDAETVAAAQLVTNVLWDDLNFEREFVFIPRDVLSTVPAPKSLDDVPIDRWRELNADGVIAGTVQRSGSGFLVRVRLFDVRSRGRQVFGSEYSGSTNARVYAHAISDEILMKQRGVRGVARSKLTFQSDRDGERLAGTVENRNVKEIYFSDYDGENQRRVTSTRSLNGFPTWSPDARAIAYMSWRRGQPQIFVSHIYEGTLDEVTKAPGENWTPAWSPDGTRIAFASSRDGNSEIYVANRDGSNVRRITNNPAIDVSPTWSPNGTEIAFTSDRSGSPQIYTVSADGLSGVQRITSESYCDRPTWSPAPFNEIAFASRTGSGFDIKVIDMSNRQVKQLTFGEGTNESPSFAPNGRHVAFTSTRSGKSQIFVMGRDGKDVKQLTKAGNNKQPSWSN